MFPELPRLKTVLLGLTVIIITLTLFIGLPVIVPSFESFNCDKYMWLCSNRGIEPIRYTTYFWDSYTSLEREDTLYQGKLNVVPVDNETTVTVSGYLMYLERVDFDENGESLLLPSYIWQGGLVNRPVTIYIRFFFNDREETSVETFRVTTGKEGFFTLDIETDSTAVCYEMTAMYPGEIITPIYKNRPLQIYHQCNATYTNCLFVSDEQENSLLWIWLIATLVAAGIVAWVIWYFRYCIVSQGVKLPPLPKEQSVKHVFARKQPETGGDTSLIEISFPDIEDGLPVVWAKDVVLWVEVKLSDMKTNRVRSLTYEVKWGDGEASQETPDKNGRFSTAHLFTHKGEYAINTLYTDNKTSRKISSWRTVRIVDYREEMVRLFNEMLKTLNLAEIEIVSEMTPREIENLLLGRLSDISRESIRKVIVGFEEANYSIHPVNRDHYVRMYRSIQEVTANDR